MDKFLLYLICASFAFAACGQQSPPSDQIPAQEVDSATLARQAALAAIRDTSYVNSDYYTRTGLASYYADGLHGKPTASGEPYDTAAFTAAHRWMPFDTEVAVTNVKTGVTVIVRVNDRGPFNKSRRIDLSKAAAKALGMLDKGVAQVKIEAQLDPKDIR
ncbi:septal ring lytic transglycosylase RlpA family protein [Cesiribacter andamanensis]|uniref:Probable endolytic peptidoglycan transglycosylase RlpA n=1 Tax=Cesiribacter andamanensis AMV16 TaxID=1279009 RepID=M7N8D6_9BACT|nr:septal ring lytic transglycosylase RlpA family protein [Cesiribacter andamanensis]EMR03476.1 RlpA-like protein precursor [Cesiribacter andamanensis AMV16]